MDEDEQVKIWERQPEEPKRWYALFHEFYLLVGPGRKLLTAVNAYKARKGTKKPSVSVPGAWRQAFDRYEWRRRAEAFDEHLAAQAQADYETRRLQILEHGLALIHERVEALSNVAEQLKGYIKESNKVFLPDVKQIGYGEFAERVDLVNFNDALFEQYRKYLADIAAEMGERVKVTKSDVTSAGEKIETSPVVFYVPQMDAEEDVESGEEGDNDGGHDA